MIVPIEVADKAENLAVQAITLNSQRTVVLCAVLKKIHGVGCLCSAKANDNE